MNPPMNSGSSPAPVARHTSRHTTIASNVQLSNDGNNSHTCQQEADVSVSGISQPTLPLSPLAWYNKADHNTLPMANPQINLDWNLAVLTYAKASLSPQEGIFCGSFVMCNLKLTARTRCLCIRRGFSSIQLVSCDKVDRTTSPLPIRQINRNETLRC